MNSSQNEGVYIEAWNGRLVTVRNLGSENGYVTERAENWRELEAQVRTALLQMETPRGGVVYPCPPELACQARFTQEVDDWMSIKHASRLTSVSPEEISRAIGRGFLSVKILDKARRKGKGRRLVRRSQVEQVCPLPLLRKLEWLADQLGADKERLIKARFWQKADVGDPHECWLWKAGRSSSSSSSSRWSKSCGTFWERGKTQAAYRVTYQLAHGPIPDGCEFSIYAVTNGVSTRLTLLSSFLSPIDNRPSAWKRYKRWKLESASEYLRTEVYGKRWADWVWCVRSDSRAASSQSNGSADIYDSR